MFDTKKEMSKAIYALSGTLNHAIAFKESFIMDKVKRFMQCRRKKKHIVICFVQC